MVIGRGKEEKLLKQVQWKLMWKYYSSFQEHNKENILQNGHPKVDLQKIFTPATDAEEIKPARQSE